MTMSKYIPIRLSKIKLYISGIYGLPARSGKLKHLEHFDANFFGVHAKQAEVMDPQLRLALESTYECIVDAGKLIIIIGYTMNKNSISKLIN